MIRWTTVPSPLGDLLLLRDEVGITGLYLPSGKHPQQPPADAVRDDAAFEDVRIQLAEYFAGDRDDFDLPLHPAGTEFMRRVWDALREIPHGETRSYRDLAEAVGSPAAVRAVGAANGRNPISIVVPCHRVIGADGALTGYGGGLPAKQWLLQHEAAQLRLLG